LAQHEVEFDVPLRPLGNADVRFVVKRNRSKYGELHVSKGAVVWVGKDKTFGRRLSWERLADVFEGEGTKRKP
jgi:hypothetical protein